MNTVYVVEADASGSVSSLKETELPQVQLVRAPHCCVSPPRCCAGGLLRTAPASPHWPSLSIGQLLPATVAVTRLVGSVFISAWLHVTVDSWGVFFERKVLIIHAN